MVGLYIGKRLGGGLSIGTRISNKQLGGCFSSMAILFIVFISLGFAIEHWKIIVPIFFLFLGWSIYYQSAKENKQEALNAAKELQGYTNKINSLITARGKLNYIGPALEQVDILEQIDPKCKIFTNRHETKSLLLAMKSTLPIH